MKVIKVGSCGLTIGMRYRVSQGGPIHRRWARYIGPYRSSDPFVNQHNRPQRLASMSESDLQQCISERIQRDGPITFAEYMRTALYEPEYGYYTTGAAKMGWEADYFTSTDVSSLFANCMGRQLFAMWEKLKRQEHFVVLEQGAGRGHLAEGVRLWAQKAAPEFYEALDYRTEDIHGGEDAVQQGR